MFTLFPVAGQIPAERSDIRMAYDEEFLYVGARLWVSSPDLISDFGKKRDMQSFATDWLGINIDTYNDKENSLCFFTNPNGLRSDGTVMNDGTPIREIEPMSLSWNTFWDVKTAMDSQGWYAEMKIPISSLRFQSSGGRTIMGISFFRLVAAKNEMYIYPETPWDWGEYSSIKPSQYAEVVFEDLDPQKPLYISPYLLAGFKQSNEINETETAYEYKQDYVIEPGLDIKYGINPNTTLDLTINTDFAQVEADDQQFNLTRLSLFLPEKRQFFLERSSIFDFSLGGQNFLFYSRRVGLHEGSPVRIWGGARLNSRINNWDIGLLNLQTASFVDQPSENFGVFRVKKRIFNPYSYAGGMLTSRLGVDGSYNLAYGLDGVIRVFGDDYLTIRWAQTFKENAQNNPFSMDPTRLYAEWARRKQEGFSYSLSLIYSGTGYDPGIGFELFDDYFATTQILKYTWISKESSWLQSHYLQMIHFHVNRIPENALLIYNINPEWYFTSKSNWKGSIGLKYRIDQLEEDFVLLDNVAVPAGEYNYLSGSLMLMTPGSSPLPTLFKLEYGAYFDGYKISPMLEPTWNLGASFELGGTYRFDYVNFPDRNQTLNNHIAGLRTLIMFSTRLSLSAFVQYNTAIHKVISNIRFRYNPREGTDLYVVFNEGRNTWLEREVPTFPVYDARNITLKFTHTFKVQH